MSQHPLRMSSPAVVAIRAAVALALMATPSLAQQAADDGGLEEIVVTAQKRAENLQDTPIAVTALTGDVLQELNRDDIASVAAQTPSLTYAEAGGESQVYIRGVGSNLFSVGADPSVAINIDGVYLGRSNMGLTQFLDVERVEVLRGPQGTLYGRNATGGAINIYSRMPTDTLEGYGSLVVGNQSRREVNGAVSGPIADRWAFRVALRSLQDDGYTKDLDPAGGSEIDDNDLKAGRGILRYQTDSLTAHLIAEYSEFDSGNTSIKPIADGLGLAASAGAVIPRSIHETRNNTPSFLEWQTGGVTLNAEWQLGESMSLTAIAAYRAWDSDFLFNTDGTEIEVTRTSQVYDTKQYSGELRLSGEQTWGKWIVGAYYLDEDKFGALGLIRAGFTNTGTRPPAIIPAATFPPRSFMIFGDNQGDAYALFGQVDYALNDAWTITAGIRYSDESKDDNNWQVTLLPDSELLGLFTPRAIPARPAAPGALNRIASQSWDAWTPKVGIQWKPSDDQLYYFSYSKGFKSGGFNSFQPSNPPYNPEFIKSFELGAKTEWLDNRVRLNASAFHYDYTDLQVSAFLNSLTFTTNAAAATVKGVELELQALATDNFEIGASLGYVDATYDNFITPYGSCNAANVALDSRCTGRVGLPRLINASGNTLNNAPEFKGALSGRYTATLGNGGELSFFAQLAHTGKVYFNPDNSAALTQDAYTVFDARVGYRNESGSLSVALFGKNLGDEEYFHNIVQFTSTSDTVRDVFNIGHALGYPAPGRQWGVELTYRFGL
jgi:iron complex outermembrane recepter protein